MRKLVLICMCSFMFGCTSVEHIPSLKNALHKEHSHIKHIKLNIESKYIVSHAQYETVKRQAKGVDAPKLKRFTSQFKKITRLNDEFRKRSTKLFLITAEQRPAWENKIKVTSDDSEWDELDKFRDYSKSEFKSLIDISDDYYKEELAFNKTLNSKKLKPYTQKLPHSPLQARRVLQQFEQENAYEKYNKELLEDLEARSKTTSKDFESLVEFAKFDKHAQNKRSQYGRFSRGKTGLSTETKEKSKSIISNVINLHIASAAKDYANKQTSLRDVSKKLLSVKKGQFSHLVTYTSQKNIQMVDEIFSHRKVEILESFVLVKSDKANTIIASQKSTENKLKELVALQFELTKKHRELLDEPVILSYFNKSLKQRAKLLREIEPRMIASIQSAESITDLNDPLLGLLAKNDQTLDVVLRIKQALSDKLKTFTAFKPVREASQLQINSFTTEGLSYESELLAIYLGDFKNARLERGSVAVSALFSKYLDAYGQFCHSYLPVNKVPITESKCKTERVTTNGWGAETGRDCVEWVEIPTGLYANPTLYSASKVASSSAGMNVFGKMLSGDPLASRSIVDDVLSLGNDMSNLVQNNKCNNAGLKRFETNLYNFVIGRAPLLLSGKESLASMQRTYNKTFDVDNLNVKVLLDDLIVENARGWMMNRYRSGSVSNINVNHRNNDGSPRTVSASYSFSSFGKIYHGDVSLTFVNSIPQCLYFSDAPQACRKPSRGIVNKYEKGKYMN